MKFYAIVGNPPYQIGYGDAGATPVYNHFINNAKIITEHYISIICPQDG